MLKGEAGAARADITVKLIRSDSEMVSIAQKTPGQKLEHDMSRARMTKKLAMRIH